MLGCLVVTWLWSCTQGGISPLGPGGSALGGPAGLGVGQATGEDELSQGEQEEGGSEISGGVFQSNPTMDAGDVAPIHDVPIHPPSIFGEASIDCKFAEEKVRMTLIGHVAHPEFEKGSSGYVDYEVGEGRTLRMVDRVEKQYVDIRVEPVAEGEGDFGEGQKNQFEVTFAVQYPFPDMPPGVQALEFYLSPGEHQAPDYGEVKDCPSFETLLASSQYSIGGGNSGSGDKMAATRCAPGEWIKVLALQPFFTSDLDKEEAPLCQMPMDVMQNVDFVIE